MRARFRTVAVMCVVLGGQMDAQKAASDPSELQAVATRGKTLVVTDTTGERMKGKVTAIDGFGIVLERKTPNPWSLGFTARKHVRRFDTHMVDTIAQPDSQLNGVLIGLAIGGGVGAVVGVQDDTMAAWFPMVAFPLLGGIVGGGIDYFVGPRQRVIYARSKTTVTVTPLLNHQSRGLVFTLVRR